MAIGAAAVIGVVVMGAGTAGGEIVGF